MMGLSKKKVVSIPLDPISYHVDLGSEEYLLKWNQKTNKVYLNNDLMLGSVFSSYLDAETRLGYILIKFKEKSIVTALEHELATFLAEFDVPEMIEGLLINNFNQFKSKSLKFKEKVNAKRTKILHSYK